MRGIILSPFSNENLDCALCISILLLVLLLGIFLPMFILNSALTVTASGDYVGMSSLMLTESLLIQNL